MTVKNFSDANLNKDIKVTYFEETCNLSACGVKSAAFFVLHKFNTLSVFGVCTFHSFDDHAGLYKNNTIEVYKLTENELKLLKLMYYI